MGKKIINAGCGPSTFRLDPDDPRLLIVGWDTDHKEGEHVLWQSRALEEPDESLAADIKARGFQSVIDVRRDGDNLEVVAGRRRVKAARLAKTWILAEGGVPPTLVVQVKRGTDLDMVEQMVAENSHRRDVHPLRMAQDLQRMLSMGAPEDRVARCAGLTMVQLHSRLRLLDLASEVQTALLEGRLGLSAAVQLADLARVDQIAALDKLATGEMRDTVADVRAEVKRARSGAAEARKAPGKRLINKILAHEQAPEIFGDDGVTALRFAFGEIDPKSIKGLTALIREVSAKPGDAE